MKRMLVLVALVFVFSAVAGSPPDSEKRKVACKTAENAKTCYWTHGRLSLYNGGSPNLRLWKIGTHRLLGIYSGPGAGPFDDGLPDEDDVELPIKLMKHDHRYPRICCKLRCKLRSRPRPKEHECCQARTIEDKRLGEELSDS
jgi:hypothetical protein